MIVCYDVLRWYEMNPCIFKSSLFLRFSDSGRGPDVRGQWRRSRQLDEGPKMSKPLSRRSSPGNGFGSSLQRSKLFSRSPWSTLVFGAKAITNFPASYGRPKVLVFPTGRRPGSESATKIHYFELTLSVCGGSCSTACIFFYCRNRKIMFKTTPEKNFRVSLPYLDFFFGVTVVLMLVL